MLTEKDNINIELYLSKELKGEEKVSFESELRSRPELMEEARFQMKIFKGLQIIETRKKRSELTDYLNKIKAESKIENSSDKTNGRIISLKDSEVATKEKKVISIWFQNPFRIALAASFAGILAIGSYYLSINDKTPTIAKIDSPKIKNKPELSSEKIKDQEFKQEELLALNDNQKLSDSYFTEVPEFRSDVPANLVKGINAFYMKDSKKALKLLPKVFPDIKEYYLQEQKDSVQNQIDNITFYRGVSYLKIKDLKNAIENLEIASNSSDETIKEFSVWYLALAYLRDNQIKHCKNILHQIETTEESRFANKATELLNKIK
jgi:hypothetical protein